jgi:hypothetical protein
MIWALGIIENAGKAIKSDASVILYSENRKSLSMLNPEP